MYLLILEDKLEECRYVAEVPSMEASKGDLVITGSDAVCHVIYVISQYADEDARKCIEEAYDYETVAAIFHKVWEDKKDAV